MKHIAVLVPQGTQIGIIDGTYDLFTEANNYLLTQGKAACFQLQMAGIVPAIPLRGGLFTASPDVMISSLKKTDLVIIPACFQSDLATTIAVNRSFLPWIARQYHAGAEIASFCIGAFLLAATGLLNEKKCATNWMVADDFNTMFPQVNLVADKIIVDEKGLYSSGGGYSYMNLILYLIEKYAGREAAVHCSKVFQIDISRDSQAAFIIFNGQKEHDDEAIKKAQAYIEKNFREKITVSHLSTMLCIGRRSLELKFKKATANTITEYLQRVKIEAAKKMFEAGSKTVAETMYEVGYSDPKTFRAIFKRTTGLSPVAYRNKYSVRQHL